ncbi:hypothetical protein J3R30DRAFT_1768058 [Lentinula aciculospora]|uniref:GLTSCR protein conserved domain-containing protein n=1 Tax=Lentinula aciculospora TaxID=153920 RepID=A0A9W9DRT7_9AGAR|nr:hypothetical protein J3R30DRAFT_1768058 [Lentinula aciculospora]
MSTISIFSPSSSSVSTPNNANQTEYSSRATPAPSQTLVTSLAGPSTWRPPAHWNIDSNAPTANPASSSIKKPSRKKDRTLEEKSIIAETSARVLSRIAADHAAVSNPDVESSFVDVIDVVNRLLPYHVFLQPAEDLTPLPRDRKGKKKASDVEDIAEIKFALECHRRRKRLEDRFRKARVKSGTGSEFNTQLVVLTQSVLDADRAEVAALNAELRAARSEYDRLERHKPASSNPSLPTSTSRSSFYTAPTQSATANGQSAYYRPYPYTYTSSFGTPAQVQGAAAIPTFSVASSTVSTPQHVNPSTILPPATSTYPTTSAIPVQLPVAFMPALNRLGINPVPVGSVPTGQPQAPAVLRGSSSNGTILNLEINVAMLQPSQMSGLAVILNSLMSRSSASSVPSAPEVPSAIALVD